MSQSAFVDELVQRGIAAAREGRYGVAQQALREAVRRAPDNEQAWLWLSGVEDNEKAKLAALHEVLRINPQNAAAQRGIDHLSQPKMVDLATLVPLVNPPPAKAGWSPPPAKAAGAVAPPAALGIAPPVRSVGSDAFSPMVESAPPSVSAEPSVVAGPADEAVEQQVAADMINDLRPAISKARKRSAWPRISEFVIGGVLLILLVSTFVGARSWLRGQVPESRFDNRNMPVARASNAATPAPDKTNNNNTPPGATAVPKPTVAVVSGIGSLFRSRTYSLQVDSSAPAADNRSVIVSVVLENVGNRALPFRARDFQLVNAANSRLTLDTNASSLVSGDLNVPAGSTIAGTLVFNGDASRVPLRLIWQPSNGGVNQQINLP